MTTPIKKIKSLVNQLPERDIILANKFINERKFSDLRDIVKADIAVLNLDEKNITSERVDALMQLKAELDSYIMLIEPDDEDDRENFW